MAEVPGNKTEGLRRVAETEQATFFERTLTNLVSAWHEIAQGARRSVGLASGPEAVLREGTLQVLMRECLEARGGEVSSRMRAAQLGEAYLESDGEGRARFLSILAKDFSVPQDSLHEAMEAYSSATDIDQMLAAERRLRRALVPPRVKLLTQFNALPEGVKFLVDLRADLLGLKSDDPFLRALDEDLRELLTSWFDVGFLDLQRITWDSPASLLEKLIAYEAVHEIRSWDDLRNRLDSDRRLYALFHPRMPEEPLAFVEVALLREIARNVQALLDETAPSADPTAANTAIFYSISNTQKGLRGISFGDYLIKQAVRQLADDLPRIKTFATLSPVPGFRNWLAGLDADSLAISISEDEIGGIRALGGSDSVPEALQSLLDSPSWYSDPVTAEALKGPLLTLLARYFQERGDNGRPLDPVARFHLQNGARLEHLNWLGDTSPNGLRQSAGMMVNYRYVLDEIEQNHEAYMKDGRVTMSSEVRSAMRGLGDNGGSRLKRLRIG